MPRLYDVALVVRSKNAGPFTLTIDIVLPSEECFDAVRPRITREAVARLYRLPEDVVVSIVPVRGLRTIKVNIARDVPAGEPGDRDVYGAQQHIPLSMLEVGEC